MNKRKKQKEWVKYSILFIVGVLIFFFGYEQGYNKGSCTIGLLNRHISESEDFIFLCNAYSEPFYSCNHNLQFRNITGLYCNNTLVCQNKLR